MTVPQGRNQKKHKGRRNTGSTVSQRRFLLDNPVEAPSKPSFEEWLLEKRNPGDWLEYEYLEEETMEDRLSRPDMSLLNRRSFLDPPRTHQSDDDDIYGDMEDFYSDVLDESDYEDFI